MDEALEGAEGVAGVGHNIVCDAMASRFAPIMLEATQPNLQIFTQGDALRPQRVLAVRWSASIDRALASVALLPTNVAHP